MFQFHDGRQLHPMSADGYFRLTTIDGKHIGYLRVSESIEYAPTLEEQKKATR